VVSRLKCAKFSVNIINIYKVTNCKLVVPFVGLSYIGLLYDCIEKKLHTVYRPQPQRSPSTVLVALLLNPGPSASPSSCVGLLNARSACHKAALIHDVIAYNKLDNLLLTEYVDSV